MKDLDWSWLLVVAAILLILLGVGASLVRQALAIALD